MVHNPRKTARTFTNEKFFFKKNEDAGGEVFSEVV